MAYPADWHDMSEYVVHFTKATDNADQYENMMSILSSQVLRAGRAFGIAKSGAPDPDSQKAVCFSEIPLHLLSRLANRRGDYGIGFTKKLLLKKKGGPVWYLEKDTIPNAAVQILTGTAVNKPTDPIWKLTPFIDAPGDYPTGAYHFEWEREWRCVGDFSFCADDVAFLIIPEKHHVAARDFFEEVITDNRGPGYLCPYVDPRWTQDQIKDALNPKTA